VGRWWVYGMFGDSWNGDLAIGGYKDNKQVLSA